MRHSGKFLFLEVRPVQASSISTHTMKKILLLLSRKLTACGREADFLVCLNTLLIGGADFAGGFGGEYRDVPFFLCENEFSATITGRGLGVLNVGLGTLESMVASVARESTPSPTIKQCFKVHQFIGIFDFCLRRTVP